VLEAEARALMKSTNMAFDDAFAHVIAEIGGDWDKWKSNLGARNRESKSSAKYKARQELVAHWQGEMTSEERKSLCSEYVKSAPSQNLLGVLLDAITHDDDNSILSAKDFPLFTTLKSLFLNSSVKSSFGHPVELDDLPWLISDCITLLGISQV
jgi:hypothetical protein